MLVVGCTSQTKGFFQTLAKQPGQQVTYCPSDSDTLDYFHRGAEKYDWLVFADLPESEEKNLVGRLHSQGVEIPMMFCRQAACHGDEEPTRTHLVGLFERSAQGFTLLGCNLAVAGANRRESENVSSGEILYEYHAPCCK